MSLFGNGKILSIDDFKDAEGNVDWKAFRKAEIDNGDLCYECGGMARLLGGPGHQVLCTSCEKLGRMDDEVDHASRLRCPHCGHIHIVMGGDWEDYEIFNEGEHEVFCYGCNKKFQIETHVSYSFTSPPRGEETDAE